MLAHVIVICINFNSQNGTSIGRIQMVAHGDYAVGCGRSQPLHCVITGCIVPILLSCDNRDITETL